MWCMCCYCRHQQHYLLFIFSTICIYGIRSLIPDSREVMQSNMTAMTRVCVIITLITITTSRSTSPPHYTTSFSSSSSPSLHTHTHTQKPKDWMSFRQPPTHKWRPTVRERESGSGRGHAKRPTSLACVSFPEYINCLWILLLSFCASKEA